MNNFLLSSVYGSVAVILILLVALFFRHYAGKIRHYNPWIIFPFCLILSVFTYSAEQTDSMNICSKQEALSLQDITTAPTETSFPNESMFRWELKDDGLYLDIGNGYYKTELSPSILHRLLEKDFLIHMDSERIYILCGGEEPAVQILSENSGETWEYSKLPNTYSNFSGEIGTTYCHEAYVCFPADGDGWLVTRAEKGRKVLHIFRSSDGGHSWRECPSINDDAYLHHVSSACFIDNKRAFLCYSLFDETPAPVFYTFDGGNSWEKLSFPFHTESVSQITAIKLQDNQVVLCMKARNDSLYAAPTYEEFYLSSKLPRTGKHFNWTLYTKNPFSQKD